MGKKKKTNKRQKSVAAGNPPGPAQTGSGAAAKLAAATLIFPPAPGSNDGFTNSASSQFVNEPASCVRELIQNSLDAALVEQKEGTARVHFSIETCKMAEVPGFAEYKKALEAGIEGAKKNRQSKNAYSPMLKAITEKDVGILHVMDNGVGFNSAKLNAMLGDGISDKGDEGASGAFGNGHLTSFALSNLRYIFYGGVLSSGNVNYTGHASLASHIGEYKGEKSALSKHGFFVNEIIEYKLDERFVFPDDGQLPSMLSRQIANIKDRWGHGALVSIPAFNYFDEGIEKNPDIILREAALNFFVAIEQKKLQVQVELHGKTEELTQGALKRIIERGKEKKRGHNGFPSGNRVWNAYCTLTDGQKYTLKTSHGDIDVFLRLNTESQKIALCRNGMWITDKLPRLRPGDFSNKVNFDALLLVDAATSGDVHTLIKVAETPLHNSIERRNVKDLDEKNKFDGMFGEIREQLKGLIEDRKTDEFLVNRIFPVEVSEAMTGNKTHNRGDSQPITGESIVRGLGTGRKKSTKASRATRNVKVKVSSRRIAENKLSVTVRAEEHCENAEIGLAVDGGRDITCAGMISNDHIMITSVLSDDINVESIQKVEDDNGKIKAVRLGKWEEGKTYNMEIGYEVPENVKGDYAIIVDLSHRKATSPTSKEATDDE